MHSASISVHATRGDLLLFGGNSATTSQVSCGSRSRQRATPPQVVKWASHVRGSPSWLVHELETHSRPWRVHSMRPEVFVLGAHDAAASHGSLAVRGRQRATAPQLPKPTSQPRGFPSLVQRM